MNAGMNCRWSMVRLRRVGVALRKFLGPLELNRPFGPDGSRGRLVMPPFVWYGRAAFCMHFPEPHALSGEQGNEDGSARRETTT